MWFVEQLLEYDRNVGEAILGESKPLPSSSPLPCCADIDTIGLSISEHTYTCTGSFGIIQEAERRKALGHFLVRVLDALNLNMENKARSYESPQLASLFLMNNYHFIHKTFTR